MIGWYESAFYMIDDKWIYYWLQYFTFLLFYKSNSTSLCIASYSLDISLAFRWRSYSRISTTYKFAYQCDFEWLCDCDIITCCHFNLLLINLQATRNYIWPKSHKVWMKTLINFDGNWQANLLRSQPKEPTTSNMLWAMAEKSWSPAQTVGQNSWASVEEANTTRLRMRVDHVRIVRA